ncbi:MAG: class I tRNA ligase family protein, partial [Candidatus Anstonellales archaeon]
MDYEKELLELWEKEGRHIARRTGDKKYFITAAFPYPNSPQHIGHARTYTIADVMARFYRLMGYSVLFPMGFHVTGTPIVAMADRIREGDRELFDIFERIYGIQREEYEKLTDPKDLVMFFAREIEDGMRRMGFMIDWSRK